jgi:putative solute:sodium symporter small subunit
VGERPQVARYPLDMGSMLDGPATARGDEATRLAAYWRANLRTLVVLLTLWFAVSFGCGILFVDQLNAYRVPGTGFKLGFWFSQQGAIYAFIVLIFVYVVAMNRLDKKFGFDEI